MSGRVLRRRASLFASPALMAASIASVLVFAGGAQAATGSTRNIAAGGGAAWQPAAAPSAADGVQWPEFPGASGDGAVTSDRSHTSGASTAVGAITQPKSVTNTAPGLITSFQGLDHFDNRFGSTAGKNQFSLEPPDQGLCAGPDGNGNTRVLETLNDVLQVYSTSGSAVTTPTALNGFFGYTPAINRTTGVYGAFVTDPSCLYDAATQRWFVAVLTLDTNPANDHFTGTNHIDLAVSNTQDPAGAWTVYRIPVQDDGTDGTPNHGCSPGANPPPAWRTHPDACFGDYPHIGADANGFYITTNEYSFFGPEFHGAQIYAISKRQLAARPASLTVTQFDTHGLDTYGFARNGFTLWPSSTPGGSGDNAARGTEYFLSSNAAAEAHDPGDGSSSAAPSTQLLTWALTNTSSLDSGNPALALSSTATTVGQYAPPPAATQKSGQQPLRDCLNSNPCSQVLNGINDPFTEKTSPLDSNDTRMQQVTWVNGVLWGALDTALSVSSAKQAGIEWFAVSPAASRGGVTAALANQGYVGLGNDNLTYPAIGMTSGGTGVMAFTLVGSDYYPSAGYATVSASGVGPVHVAAPGVGPEDGFSDYKLFGDPAGTDRPRWGDYGAAVAVGSNVWMASEYIGQSCSLSDFETSAFRCGNTRTALANWATRISEVAAP